MVVLKNQFYMAFYATALAISISVLLFTLLSRRTDRPQNKWFLVLLSIVTLNSISEVSTAIFESIAGDSTFNYYALGFSQNTYFLFHSALCPMLYNYVCSVTGKNRRRPLAKTLFLNVPFLITEVFAIINPFNNWVFYYDANFHFVRNWAEYIIYAVALFYFVLSVFELFFSWHAMTPRRSVALTYLFTLTFLGVFIQLINQDIKAELFSEALALMGCMLAVESEDDRIDADTGIYNRRALHMDIHNILTMKEDALLIYIKIGNANIIKRVAKSINYDVLAISVAEFLKTLFPRYNIYRPNKETFVILCKKSSETQTEFLVESIKFRFEQPWLIYDSAFNLDAQIFSARIPTDVNSYEDITYIADSIIPTNVMANSAEIDWILRKSDIEKSIKNALVNGGLEVYYQPTLNARNLTVHGAEALIRMHDERLGFISPEEFVPIAEQIGLVDKIDNFVLTEVCKLIKSGILAEYNLDYINVNLSVIECLQPGFFEHIIKTVDNFDIDHSVINFEITESVGAEDYEKLAQIAKNLKSSGFALSMDDYGTGYSNMDGMFALDFDVVKIDKSILWSAMEDHKGRVILENSIRMIRGLGSKVLVEGVETKEQVDLLQSYEIDYMQGYYFSKPLSKSKFLDYLAN
jgi:EAL domain-containing protein (putative c-di-GMP-specific phosphodiesterase class I)/GGDEF domain-containing protein